MSDAEVPLTFGLAQRLVELLSEQPEGTVAYIKLIDNDSQANNGFLVRIERPPLRLGWFGADK